MVRVCVSIVALCSGPLAATSVAAQSAENVAVIINEAEPASVRVGEHYVAQRGVPAAHVIRLRTVIEETIERDEFVRTVQEPIATALERGRLQDRVLYLVLTKGLPLRIAGTPGHEGTVSSVDSELTLLYRRMVGQAVLTRGRVDNPYYLGTRDIAEARPFIRRDHDIFLVSRIDGFTVEQALALVDRGTKPTTEGRVVLDQRGVPSSQLGDRWLATSATRLAAAGHEARVLLETTPQVARDVGPVLGYYSWGSSDPNRRSRDSALRFAPGAIAASFVSTDARTMRAPPEGWAPSDVLTAASLHAGTGHSLSADLIREGVTGVAGNVAEPYLQSVVRPEVLFPAYLAGFNLVESFYLAMPHLSWQGVVIGDPLCAPFPRPAVDPVLLDPAIDPDTDLPSAFAARRLAQTTKAFPTFPARAVTMWVRARGLLARDDREGAMRAFDQALEAAPGEIAPRIELAQLHEQRQEYDQAVALYRRVVDLAPRNVVALNNLGYALAVRQGRPAEGKPFAERALALLPTQGLIIDTLAWIEHLMGDNVSAATRLAEAIRLEPGSAEIRLHAAIVFAETGARAQAARELKEALRLDPRLESTDDARRLLERLKVP